MKKVFIDGSAGTAGLRIAERLASRKDLEFISLPEARRKDIHEREAALNEADIAILCLPDEASREAVSLIKIPIPWCSTPRLRTARRPAGPMASQSFPRLTRQR